MSSSRRPNSTVNWQPAFYLFYTFNICFIVYFWSLSSFDLLSQGYGNALLALARLSGLLGMFSVLVQFVLIARARWLESAFGFDRLTRLHHWNGLVAFTLITAHIPLVVIGTADLSGLAVPAQLRIFLGSYPYVLWALVAYLLLVVTIALSITIVKRHLRYEVWYFVHFANYAVVLLVFWHQVNNGTTLLSHEWFRAYWYGLFTAVLANLALARFLRPLWLYLKYRFKVERVEPAAGRTVSIYIGANNLNRFKWRGGQFAKWRFMARGLWYEEHPFTISIEPNAEHLRLTPKAIGDYSAKLQTIRPGTPVMISGPLGVFTLGLSSSDKVLMIAGGIGITPLRAMLENTNQTSGRDIILLYSARNQSDLALKSELDSLARSDNIRVVYILAEEKVTGLEQGRLDADTLQRLVPDIAARNVFICGPPPMMDALAAAAGQLGVSKQAIHMERFSL